MCFHRASFSGLLTTVYATINLNSNIVLFIIQWWLLWITTVWLPCDDERCQKDKVEHCGMIWKRVQTNSFKNGKRTKQLFSEVCCTCNCNKLRPIYKLAGPHHGLPLWWFIQLTSLTCYYSAAWPMYVCVLSNWDHSKLGQTIYCKAWAELQPG